MFNKVTIHPRFLPDAFIQKKTFYDSTAETRDSEGHHTHFISVTKGGIIKQGMNYQLNNVKNG